MNIIVICHQTISFTLGVNVFELYVNIYKNKWCKYIFTKQGVVFNASKREHCNSCQKNIAEDGNLQKSIYRYFFHQLQATENKKVLVLQIQQFWVLKADVFLYNVEIILYLVITDVENLKHTIIYFFQWKVNL